MSGGKITSIAELKKAIGKIDRSARIDDAIDEFEASMRERIRFLENATRLVVNRKIIAAQIFELDRILGGKGERRG